MSISELSRVGLIELARQAGKDVRDACVAVLAVCLGERAVRQLGVLLHLERLVVEVLVFLGAPLVSSLVRRWCRAHAARCTGV